jgi:hypothetical protein
MDPALRHRPYVRVLVHVSWPQTVAVDVAVAPRALVALALVAPAACSAVCGVSAMDIKRVAVLYDDRMLSHDTGSGFFELQPSPLLEVRDRHGVLCVCCLTQLHVPAGRWWRSTRKTATGCATCAAS